MYYTVYDLDARKIGIAINNDMHGLFYYKRFPLSAIIMLSVLGFMVIAVSIAAFIDYKII